MHAAFHPACYYRPVMLLITKHSLNYLPQKKAISVHVRPGRMEWNDLINKLYTIKLIPLHRIFWSQELLPFMISPYSKFYNLKHCCH
jgi:hypothetical protein